MPKALTFPLAGALGGSVSGTTAAAPTFYAYARKLDPLTGDMVFDDSAGTWTAGHPMAERIVRCLRTPRGTALRDPTYGIDTSLLDNARDNAPALVRGAILDALKRYTDRGLLVIEEVTVEVQDTALLYEVRARDPRDPSQQFGVQGSL